MFFSTVLRPICSKSSDTIEKYYVLVCNERSDFGKLQVASFLARAPQAHMSSERGVTWHTPTPPPHLYHVPAPSPPDPLQAMKNSGGNSVFRHTATPPELYRHTPTPPDKHLMRHTPSPGDMKAGASLPPADLYPHLGPGRDKLVRPEELLAYARGGVDLSLGGARGANGAPAPAHAPHASPALSVRDAPTINSLIARAQPRHPHARVDALLERLVPAPVSPHSVIVHSRAAPTPSPPSSNEDSADSCGAPPGSKRKRKPERTLRVPSAPPPAAPAPAPSDPPSAAPARTTPPPHGREREPQPIENGDTPYDKRNGPVEKPKDETPQKPPSPPQPPPEPHARRKHRSGSAETIDDIAAMIASTDQGPLTETEKPPEPDAPVTIDKLKSVLSSPEGKPDKVENPTDTKNSPNPENEKEILETPVVEAAAAPKRRSARTSNSESTNVPVESPSEAKPAEAEASEVRSTEPTAAFVEVENQLEKMFAGLEEDPKGQDGSKKSEKPSKSKKRRKSAPTKGESKAARRAGRASVGEERRKGPRKKGVGKGKEGAVKDAYDSGSNASSSRSRGPYIQIRGPRDSPLSVSVINAATGDDEAEASTSRRKGGESFRNGLRARGLHASTLGLRYDATTPDATWLCAFCERGPHAAGLGDLFGPYTVETDCDEYRSLDEATRQRYESESNEVWFHEACGVWAPGLVAAGARLWGLASAVWAARGARCGACARAGACVACSARGCRARTHVPCAPRAAWLLRQDEFRAVCPRHA